MICFWSLPFVCVLVYKCWCKFIYKFSCERIWSFGACFSVIAPHEIEISFDLGLSVELVVRLNLRHGFEDAQSHSPNFEHLFAVHFAIQFFFNLKFESRLDKIFKSICFELLWIYFYFSHGLIIKWRKFYSFSQFFWTNAAASAPNSSSHRISSQQFVAVHEQTFSVCFPLNICSLKISI